MYTTREIQKALLAKGFDPGPVDGIPGPKTNSAIIRFKISMGLETSYLPTTVFLHYLFETPLQVSPSWLRLGKMFVGVKEFAGKQHNNTILEWWKRIMAPFEDDETPWCAAFVGAMLEECGIRSTRSAMARSYEKWGVELSGPALGAVVVFWRGNPKGSSGHVGFVVGRDSNDNLLVLGGNQGNEVSIKPFSLERVLSYRWHMSQSFPRFNKFSELPFFDSANEISYNEQ